MGQNVTQYCPLCKSQTMSGPPVVQSALANFRQFSLPFLLKNEKYLSPAREIIPL